MKVIITFENGSALIIFNVVLNDQDTNFQPLSFDLNLSASQVQINYWVIIFQNSVSMILINKKKRTDGKFKIKLLTWNIFRNSLKTFFLYKQVNIAGAKRLKKK